MVVRHVEVDEDPVLGSNPGQADSGSGQRVSVLEVVRKSVQSKPVEIGSFDRPPTEDHCSGADDAPEVKTPSVMTFLVMTFPVRTFPDRTFLVRSFLVRTFLMAPCFLF